jgi:hypothetical protein
MSTPSLVLHQKSNVEKKKKEPCLYTQLHHRNVLIIVIVYIERKSPSRFECSEHPIETFVQVELHEQYDNLNELTKT